MDGYEGLLPTGAQAVDDPGDEFLSGTARTGEEHGSGGGGHLTDHAVHFFHLLPQEDHLRGGEPLPELLRKELDFRFRVGLLQYAADDVTEFIRTLERFCQVVGRTGLHGLDGVSDRSEGGDDDPTSIRPKRLPLAHDVQPGEVGHPEIGDHEVELCARKCGQGILAAVRLHHTVSLLFENGGEEGPHQVVVVHDQDRFRHDLLLPPKGGGLRERRLSRLSGWPGRSAPPFHPPFFSSRQAPGPSRPSSSCGTA